MNKYYTYGLNIHSNIELPLWLASLVNGHEAREPDILIQRFDARELSRELPDRGYEMSFSEERAEVLTEAVGEIRVEPGTPVRLSGWPLLSTSDLMLSHWFSGSALAMAIHYHGHLPLHGCALRIGDKTVVFMGRSGMGKSSLCAALCHMGHQVINDDISPVTWIDGKAHILPGYPRMKLNGDLLQIMNLPEEDLVELHELHHKKGWLREKDCFFEPQPLDALFFLGIGDRDVKPVLDLSAFSLLQRCATPTQWNFEGGKDHFLACGRLLKEVPAYVFLRERDLSQLFDQAEYVEQKVMNLANSSS